MAELTPPLIVREMGKPHPSTWKKALGHLSVVAVLRDPTKPFPTIDMLVWHAAGNLDPLVTFATAQPKPMQPADGEARSRVPKDVAREMGKRIRGIQTITGNPPKTEHDWRAVDSYLDGLLERANNLVRSGNPEVTKPMTKQDLLLFMCLNHSGARSLLPLPDVVATLRTNPSAAAFLERFRSQFAPPKPEDVPRIK